MREETCLVSADWFPVGDVCACFCEFDSPVGRIAILADDTYHASYYAGYLCKELLVILLFDMYAGRKGFVQGCFLTRRAGTLAGASSDA